jgi:hypothetical protein
MRRWAFEFKDELDERLCHTVRIAVLADSGENRVFVFGPGTEGGDVQILCDDYRALSPLKEPEEGEA